MEASGQAGGFTLIEVLIGMVILTIVSLGLTSLTLTTMHGTGLSVKMTTATTLAHDRLEYVRRLGYTNAGTAAGLENYGTIANFTGFRRETTVAANTPAANITTVTVTVYWDTDTHSTAASTLLAE